MSVRFDSELYEETGICSGKGHTQNEDTPGIDKRGSWEVEANKGFIPLQGWENNHLKGVANSGNSPLKNS